MRRARIAHKRRIHFHPLFANVALLHEFKLIVEPPNHMFGLPDARVCSLLPGDVDVAKTVSDDN